MMTIMVMTNHEDNEDDDVDEDGMFPSIIAIIMLFK